MLTEQLFKATNISTSALFLRNELGVMHVWEPGETVHGITKQTLERIIKNNFSPDYLFVTEDNCLDWKHYGF